MATEKTLKTRVVLKHDTEANWETAGNATNPFIPKKGEVIIYDPDDTHTCSRQKVGDGIKNVNELPFLGATVGMADSFKSLSKIQYTAESAIPATPDEAYEYAITDLISYGDLNVDLQERIDHSATVSTYFFTESSWTTTDNEQYGQFRYIISNISGTSSAFISVYDSNGYLQQDIHIRHYSGTVTIYSNNKINGSVCIIKA